MSRSGGNLPKTLNQASARKLLEGLGWTMKRGGKHVIKMCKEGHRPVTLPAARREDYGPVLRQSILRAAGLLDEKDGG